MSPPPFIFGPRTSARSKPWVSVPQALNDDEIARIIELGDAHCPQTAIVGSRGRGAERPEIRSSRVSWFKTTTPNVGWLYDRLSGIVAEVNDRTFNFDLFGFCEPLQYSIYEAPSGHYDWHVDNGGMLHPRKLSLSLQLSAADDYEGGNLEIWNSGGPQTVPKGRGTVVVFPSYALHRVTPVTSGIRKALVVWANGPEFR